MCIFKLGAFSFNLWMDGIIFNIYILSQCQIIKKKKKKKEKNPDFFPQFWGLGPNLYKVFWLCLRHWSLFLEWENPRQFNSPVNYRCHFGFTFQLQPFHLFVCLENETLFFFNFTLPHSRAFSRTHFTWFCLWTRLSLLTLWTALPDAIAVDFLQFLQVKLGVGLYM